MICTVWSIDDSPAARDVFYRHERDLELLIEREAQLVDCLRVDCKFGQRHATDEHPWTDSEATRRYLRRSIAVLRAVRFAIEVLS